MKTTVITIGLCLAMALTVSATSPIPRHPSAPAVTACKAVEIAGKFAGPDPASVRYCSSVTLVEGGMTPAPNSSARHWLVILQDAGGMRDQQRQVYVDMNETASDTVPPFGTSEIEIQRVESLNPKVGPAAPAAETIVMEGSTVELPQGFKHTADVGEDSAPGHFTSADGAFVIRYDHGKMAGVYATSEFVKPIISSTEVKAGDLVGLMVVYGEAPQKVVVSFPQGGPANFFAEVRNKDDIEVVRKLAVSFRFKSD